VSAPRRRLAVDPYFAAGVAAVLAAGIAYRAYTAPPPAAAPSPPFPEAGTLAALESLGEGHSLGAADAPLQVVEFTDYQCPACAVSRDSTWPAVLRHVEAGTVRYTAYDLPLPRHASAITAAVVAGCAGEHPGAGFWEVRSALLAHQAEWADVEDPAAAMLRAADAVGADSAAVRECMARDGPRRAAALRRAWETASSQGITFTPAWFVNGRMVPWPRLATALDSALAGLPATGTAGPAPRDQEAG
jgi:protein-disulfide isomerase